jgi:transposase
MGEGVKGLGFEEGKEVSGREQGSIPSRAEAESFRLKEGDVIRQEEFQAIQVLKREGMKKRKAAKILGMDRKTVGKYWKKAAWEKRAGVRKGMILDSWREHLLKRAPETDYSAVVCFLDIQKRGYRGSYGPVKKFIRPLREDRRRLEEATMRFETGPGKQAQVDWGSTRIELGGQAVRIHLFVMVLGYSRRIYVRAQLDEKLPVFLGCHEGAFEWFGGLTHTSLYDPPKTVYLSRDFEGKEIGWNPQFLDFSRYWGYAPRLCKPYRARTKGKVESGVKYVKSNFFGLYGRCFRDLEELNQKLETWALEVADERIHGTTHEKPSERFKQETLISLQGKAPYRIEDDITRIIPRDAQVVYKTNRYSVPWRYWGRRAVLLEQGERLAIFVEGNVVADHPLLGGRWQQSILSGHYEGILDSVKPKPKDEPLVRVSLWPQVDEEVEARDLASYEALAGAAESPGPAEVLVAGGAA